MAQKEELEGTDKFPKDQILIRQVLEEVLMGPTNFLGLP